MSAKTLITAWFSDDQQLRGQYLQQSDTIFRSYGMQNVTFYSADTALVGELKPDAIVLLEWDDVERCRECFSSPEYTALSDLRSQAFERLDITLLGEGA